MSKPNGELGRLIQAYKDQQEYRVSNAQIAARLEVSRTTIGHWLSGEVLPTADNLRRLADLMRVPYTRALDAALIDAGYLPQERERDAPPITPAPTHDGPRFTGPKVSDEPAEGAEVTTGSLRRAANRRARPGVPRQGQN